MSDIEILSTKFVQPLQCKCGRALSGSDITSANENIEIVCSACHASVLKIELLPSYEEPWDD